MNDTLLFMFNAPFCTEFFKIRTPSDVYRVIADLFDIGIDAECIELEERDENGMVTRNPYILGIYEGPIH